jgi:DNA/RNA-binding domain of Phe-tRNA-synthetase-like protein
VRRKIAHAAKGNVEYHFTHAELDRARQVSEFPFDRFRIWSDISKKERDAVCTRFYKKFNHKGWGRSGYQALLKRLIEDHNMGLKKEVIDADVEMTIDQ